MESSMVRVTPERSTPLKPGNATRRPWAGSWDRVTGLHGLAGAPVVHLAHRLGFIKAASMLWCRATAWKPASIGTDWL